VAGLTFVIGLRLGANWGVRMATIRDATGFHQLASLLRAGKIQNAQDAADDQIKSALPLVVETARSSVFRQVPGTDVASSRAMVFLDYFSKYPPKRSQVPADFFASQPDMSPADRERMTAWLDSIRQNEAEAFALIDAYVREQKAPRKEDAKSAMTP
jgi:hypothetical protein